MIQSKLYTGLVLLVGMVVGVLLWQSNPGGIREYSTKKEYAEVMTWLQQGLINNGYEIEKIQPIDRGLGKTGRKIETYRIVFFNPGHTLDSIQEKYPGFSALLPLAITVSRHNNKLKIVGPPYKVLLKAAKGQDLRALIKIWQQDSNRIIKQALLNSESGLNPGSS